MSAAATTAAVKTALLTRAGLDASGINVDTSPDGKLVILKGTVKTAADKAAAEKTAHAVFPAMSVRNELTVK
jgi:osmotically-inducible protein OsmY